LLKTYTNTTKHYHNDSNSYTHSLKHKHCNGSTELNNNINKQCKSTSTTLNPIYHETTHKKRIQHRTTLKITLTKMLVPDNDAKFDQGRIRPNKT